MVVAGTSGAAVSVAPSEQAETNMLRTSNPATQRFTPGVFHESRSATPRESLRRAPLRLSNIGKPWAADCDNLCHQALVAKPESTDRPEISGLPSSFSWWSWGESNPRPSKSDRACYDHSRVCGFWLPPRRVGRATRAQPRGLSPGSAVCPCCQRSVPAVSTASVAGLRWTDPACRYRSR